MIGSYSLADATIWQDLDNDGVKDVGEPSTTSSHDGRFNITISKSETHKWKRMGRILSRTRFFCKLWHAKNR